MDIQILAFAAAGVHKAPYSQVEMTSSTLLVPTLTMISVKFVLAFRRTRIHGRFQSFMRGRVLLSFF